MRRTKIARAAVPILFLVTAACSSILPQNAPVVLPTLIPTSEGGLPRSEAEVPRVSLADTRAALESGEAVIVDVRAPDAFALSHIAGAISIPLGQIELDPAGIALDKDQWIITYCT